MSISVRGSRTHRSLLKKILWKTIKYFVKSVDIMPIKTKATAKTAPVPTQRDFGIRRFNAAVRSALYAPRNKPGTRSIG